MSQTRVKRKSTAPAPRSPWPFVVMAIGAAVILVVGFWVLRWSDSSSSTGAPQTTSGARLSVDRTTIDFGKVPLDKMVKAEFKIKNVGNQPLIVKAEPRVELVKGC